MLVDNHNRRINYLRLSVTDRCNLRCLYCVPHYDVTENNKSRILPYEDLFRLARESVALGISKIRVTGGEPLVRPGVIEFMERLAAIEPAPEVVVTTNGILLKKLAAPLRKAGVKRLNISLDSLRPRSLRRLRRAASCSGCWTESTPLSRPVSLRRRSTSCFCAAPTKARLRILPRWLPTGG